MCIQTVYLPYNVHNNNQLYQPIDKSNLLAFYMHYLGCIVLKQGRKDGITNFSARDHADDTVVTGEPAATAAARLLLQVYTLCMAKRIIPHSKQVSLGLCRSNFRFSFVLIFYTFHIF